MRGVGRLVGLILAAAILFPAAGAAQMRICPLGFCGYVSDDGGRALFASFDRITPTPSRVDLYVREDGVTRPVVPGLHESGVGVQVQGLTANAERIFVTSAQALTSDDTDPA